MSGDLSDWILAPDRLGPPTRCIHGLRLDGNRIGLGIHCQHCADDADRMTRNLPPIGAKAGTPKKVIA